MSLTLLPHFSFPRKWSRSGNGPCCIPPCLLLGNSINMLAAAWLGQNCVPQKDRKAIPKVVTPILGCLVDVVLQYHSVFATQIPTMVNSVAHKSFSFLPPSQTLSLKQTARSFWKCREVYDSPGFISLLGQQALGLLVFLAVGGAACWFREPSADESRVSLEKDCPRRHKTASCLGQWFQGLELKELHLAAIIKSWRLRAASD